MQTPWGKSDYSKKYCRGVVFYGTPSHGGFHVSPTMNVKIPVAMRNADGWYEEDCEFAKVAFAFPELNICPRNEAIQSLKSYSPDEYEATTGEIIPIEESYIKRERKFAEDNKNNWVVISAMIQDDLKTVLCYATIGGKRGENVPEKRFLVPKENYNAPFVIDPSKYEETEKTFY